MHKLEIDARAKINFTLDVLWKRPDGYHEVEMIMQTLSLKDHLTLELLPERHIELSCDSDLVPRDERNLAWKAARIMLDEFAPDTGVKIHLKKNIPVAAGLAGGSADAAAVIVGLNELLGLKISTQQLQDIGKKLGADIPFCILGGTALARGIGEKLTILKPAPKMNILLYKPPFGVSTKEVYNRLDVKNIKQRPATSTMVKTIEKQDIVGIARGLCNVLETVTFDLYPELSKVKQQFKDCGALGSLMSGSGPTIFGIFESAKDAKKAEERMTIYGDFFITQVD